MTLSARRLLAPLLLIAFCASAGAAPADPDSIFDKGQKAYLKQNYQEAERQFRAYVKQKPDSWHGHLYLGHALYYQGKYPESIAEYEKARELGTKSGAMKPPDERLLNVQVGMAYGNGGKPLKAKAIFEDAIKKDPDYAMYYYNLACCHAELGNLDMALAVLKQAYERKGSMLSFESFPNPRNDPSFKKYVGNPKFEAALKEMGF